MIEAERNVVAGENKKKVKPARPASTQAGSTLRQGILHLQEKQYSYGNAKEAMVLVFKKLAKNDSSFLERCAQHPDAQGRKRRYLARSKEELYPDRPDLRYACERIDKNWLVGTNISNREKMKLIRMAADVAGLVFGKDIAVEF